MEIANSSEILQSHSRRQFVFIVVVKRGWKLVFRISQNVCKGNFFSVPVRHQKFIPSVKWLDLLDVRGSVHHSTIYKEIPAGCNNVSKCYFSIFIWSSTCSGRHTSYHQKPNTALAASGFSYMEGCWTCSCWTLTTSTTYTSQQPSTYEKPEAASVVLGSLWWALCRPKHVEFHINME
jgi:hypothetical protein